MPGAGNSTRFTGWGFRQGGGHQGNSDHSAWYEGSELVRFTASTFAFQPETIISTATGDLTLTPTSELNVEKTSSVFVRIRNTGGATVTIGAEDSAAFIGTTAGDDDFALWSANASQWTVNNTGGHFVPTGTQTLGITGTRLTNAYFTNHTSTNDTTVDSSETVKHDIKPYMGDALSIIRGVDIITFQHDAWLDPSDEIKLGIRAESVKEPLAIREIDRGTGKTYPGLNTYGFDTLLTKAVQQLDEKVETIAELNERIAALEAK